MKKQYENEQQVKVDIVKLWIKQLHDHHARCKLPHQVKFREFINTKIELLNEFITLLEKESS